MPATGRHQSGSDGTKRTEAENYETPWVNDHFNVSQNCGT